ncbi:hypothetical protein ACJJIR_18025 [Microbulbifer sp. SSSA008]
MDIEVIKQGEAGERRQEYEHKTGGIVANYGRHKKTGENAGFLQFDPG